MSGPRLRKGELRDIASIHGVGIIPRVSSTAARASKSGYSLAPQGNWKERQLVTWMQKTPGRTVLSANSLGNSTLHDKRNLRGAKRALDISSDGGLDHGNSHNGDSRSVKRRKSGSEQHILKPGHRFSWDQADNADDPIDMAVDGKPGGSRELPIDIDDQDDLDHASRRGLTTSRAAGPSSTRKPAHTPGSASAYRMNSNAGNIEPSKTAMQVSPGSSDAYGLNDNNPNMRTSRTALQGSSATSGDELDLIGKRDSKSPIYGHRHAPDRLPSEPLEERPTPASASHYAHDSLPKHLAPDLSVTRPKEGAVQGIRPQYTGTFQTRRSRSKSPSYEATDDPIEPFSEPETTSSSRPGHRGKGSHLRPSPAIEAIPHGNTKAKAERYNAPGPATSSRRDKEIHLFAQNVKAQQGGQANGSSSGGKMIERMKGKQIAQPDSVIDMTEASDEDFARSTRRSHNALATSRSAPAASTSNGFKPKPTHHLPNHPHLEPSPITRSNIRGDYAEMKSNTDNPRLKASEAGLFSAPLDDIPIQRSPVSSMKPVGIAGSDGFVIPIECVYFGGQKISTSDPAKTFHLTWTQSVLTLRTYDNDLITMGLFGTFDTIQVNSKPDDPAVCVLKGGDEWLGKAADYFHKFMRLEDDKAMRLKLATNGKNYPACFARLKASMATIPKDSRLDKQHVEHIQASTAAGLLKVWDGASRPQKIDSSTVNDQDNVYRKDGPVQTEKKHALLPTSRPATRAPGTPIDIPSNRSAAPIPQRRHSPPVTPSTRPVTAKRRQSIPETTTRELRSSKSRAAEQPLHAIFGNNKPSGPDPNELLLVWPLDSKTGAVHITNGDFSRLAPQEFLNDTLIEFGLKLWFKDFTEQHPEVAADVYMFNTFFYKKISNKDFATGYDSVKKWTNKVDIFDKKYIIVPINEHLHWYLAIIYNPKGILRPPLPVARPEPRKSARLSAVHPITEAPDAAVALSEQSSEAAEETEVKHMTVLPMSEEQDVTMHEASPLPASPIASTTNAEESHMDIDQPQEDATEPTTSLGQSPELGDSAVPNQERDRGVSEILQPLSTGSEEGLEEETLIFTFDSLGGGHKAAGKVLSRYLRAEAEHKKHVVDTRDGITKTATVPTQQNYCDCGLFVLHFVEKFMEQPEQFIRDFYDKEKHKKKEYWDLAWDKTAVDDKRSLLQAKITSLSEQWKASRKGEEKKGKEKEGSIIPSGEDTAQGSVSDDDDGVEIVGENRKAPSPKKKRRGAVEAHSDEREEEVEGVRPRVDRPERRTRRASPVQIAEIESSQEVTVTGSSSMADRVKGRPRRTSARHNPFVRD